MLHITGACASFVCAFVCASSIVCHTPRLLIHEYTTLPLFSPQPHVQQRTQHTHTHTPYKKVGVSIIIVLYAIVTFYWRAHAIRTRSAGYVQDYVAVTRVNATAFHDLKNPILVTGRAYLY